VRLSQSGWARGSCTTGSRQIHHYGKARLSAQIGRLEADLGHTLVERAVSRQHPMTLTSFGEELAQAARRIDGP
jgi:DNA-binding transcriptional LysR family regulator